MANDEFGDFQTPLPLASAVLQTLGPENFVRVLEPTCGQGNFLQAAALAGIHEAIGIEIQPKHATIAARWGQVIEGDIFRLDTAAEPRWRSGGPLLVVGNPPWVTSAALSRFDSANVPVKKNLKGLRGLEALTGSANFDVAEYIWLKLLVELAAEEPTIALLCKTQVARNVLSYAAEAGLRVAEATMRRLDAQKWFGASVDACLFTVKMGPPQGYSCFVFSSLDAATPERRIGVRSGRLLSDMDAYESVAYAHGDSPVEWRQGLKHDAAKVMELRPTTRGLVNGAGEVVQVEAEFAYPLLKCTDVHKGNVVTPQKRVLVPQRFLGEETEGLAERAPRLWAYLNANGERLDGRKSSIYRNRPRFSVFGIGPYTFAPWKVAVSGLHKAPAFRLVPGLHGMPAVLDDTCYFLPFEKGDEAALVHALLESPEVKALLDALVFTDAKRPITKKILQQVDLLTLLRDARESLSDAAAGAARSVGLRHQDWDATREELLTQWVAFEEPSLSFA